MVGKDMLYHLYNTYTHSARYQLLDRRSVLKIPVKHGHKNRTWPAFCVPRCGF